MNKEQEEYLIKIVNGWAKHYGRKNDGLELNEIQRAIYTPFWIGKREMAKDILYLIKALNEGRYDEEIKK